jgi:hypothetical protein
MRPPLALDGSVQTVLPLKDAEISAYDASGDTGDPAPDDVLKKTGRSVMG